MTAGGSQKFTQRQGSTQKRKNDDLPEPDSFDRTGFGGGRDCGATGCGLEILPKAAQKLILDEQAELERYMGPKGKELKAGEIAKLKGAGIKFVEMSAEETKNWKNIANVARWNAVKKKLSADQYAKIRKMITR